ncbi:mannitol dehydrogenase family protein [Seohaeicola nanhaiensis]|uniref:Mannitol dehydrogenase family protein n=1 Tax=Seohaeicola nanhaiensis TaxID=1387282 RepID=A0ABV9KNZ0_9RHOB
MEAGLPDRLTRRTPKPKTGMVHLGPGAFFRAFQAIYTADAMAARGGDWGILAVSLKSPTARDQLGPQEGAFTAVELGPQGRNARIVESVTGVLVAPEDPGAVIAAMADPGVKIVSLTITEKGYCHEPATGRLNRSHPEIVHDLAHPDLPQSAPGFLVAALARRRAAGMPPFTVLTCDNLPSNGHLAQGIVIDFARAIDPDLAAWIAAHVPFPATMVDRITPATTEADIDALAQAEGYLDPACVMHEPFRQWVIEDDFADGRPAWEVAGAQFVRDVEAHETMKLRCLNGTHSALAYLGYLAGYQTIAETVADPAYAALCHKLWHDEILPTVPRPEGEDLAAYCAALLDRYRNPGIRHRTWQIAMDGSQKLPQRILGTVRDALAAGRVPTGLCLVVAAWMRYVGGIDETGAPIDVRDPLAGALRAASGSADTPEGKVAALLGVTQVFDPALAADTRLRAGVTDAYVRLAGQGARATVAEWTGAA